MLFYIFLALVTGVMLAFSTTMNAVLSKRIGIFPGTLVNYLTGLLGATICVLLAGSFTFHGLPKLTAFSLIGGALGVLVVAMTNYVLPRVPVVYATILMFAGQVLVGMVMDWIGGQQPTLIKFAGWLLIMGGLFINTRIDGEMAPKAGGGPQGESL